jgi:hypothetical protein
MAEICRLVSIKSGKKALDIVLKIYLAVLRIWFKDRFSGKEINKAFPRSPHLACVRCNLKGNVMENVNATTAKTRRQRATFNARKFDFASFHKTTTDQQEARILEERNLRKNAEDLAAKYRHELDNARRQLASASKITIGKLDALRDFQKHLVKLIETLDGSKPAKVEPTKPIQPTKPIDPIEPIEPVQPTKPTKVTEEEVVAPEPAKEESQAEESFEDRIERKMREMVANVRAEAAKPAVEPVKIEPAKPAPSASDFLAELNAINDRVAKFKKGQAFEAKLAAEREEHKTAKTTKTKASPTAFKIEMVLSLFEEQSQNSISFQDLLDFAEDAGFKQSRATFQNRLNEMEEFGMLESYKDGGRKFYTLPTD